MYSGHNDTPGSHHTTTQLRRPTDTTALAAQLYPQTTQTYPRGDIELYILKFRTDNISPAVLY